MNALSRLNSISADALNGPVLSGDAAEATGTARVAPHRLDPLVAALAKAVARRDSSTHSSSASP